jgi:hypothetical protein
VFGWLEDEALIEVSVAGKRVPRIGREQQVVRIDPFDCLQIDPRFRADATGVELESVLNLCDERRIFGNIAVRFDSKKLCRRDRSVSLPTNCEMRRVL